MKLLVLLVALCGLPVLSAWARGNARVRSLLATLVGFLPFFNIDIYLVSDITYRGDAQGLEISLVDLVALALVSALPKGRGLPDRWLRAAYLLAACASLWQAPRPVFAVYGLAKIVRFFFLGAVAARLARQPRLGPALLRGLALGVIYACLVALQQRYLHGRMQTPGPFVHQNGLGMTANLVAPALFALVLAGQGGRLAAIGVGAAALSIVLSLSRGALTMFPVALGLVYLFSVRRRYSARKLVVLLVALAALAVVLAKSMDSIVNRFTKAPKSSGEGRELFEESARHMLHDHPLGVGLNQFSWVQSTHGYGERVGLPPSDHGGLVHNVYWLTAAELGWPGLITLLLVMVAPLLRAVWAIGRGWRGEGVHADLLLGLTAALLVTYLHSTLEWALRITPISQVMWIVYGLVAALAEQVRGRVRG